MTTDQSDDFTQGDHLQQMFKKQQLLQLRLGTFPLKSEEDRVEFIKNQTLALLDEAHEALRETPWKPWKKQQVMNHEAFKEELVDAWHFLINLTLASGMRDDELFERFTQKNKVNHERQSSGY